MAGRIQRAERQLVGRGRKDQLGQRALGPNPCPGIDYSCHWGSPAASRHYSEGADLVFAFRLAFLLLP